jgi:membrane-bound acyltransferase YfiQ involved in biofilm formation
MFVALFVIMALPYLGVEQFDLTLRLLAIKIVLMLTGVVYLTYVFSYGKFRLKRRGFLLAGTSHVCITGLFGWLFYPVVGFAIALFYVAAAYKLAQSKLHNQPEHYPPL